MREAIIGIDLGTTNSEVAIVENGKPRVIEEGGTGILPSAVGLDASGRLLVGEPALNQMLLTPERTVRSIKRKMGSEEKVRLGDVAYTPQEISAVILRHLKGRAERELGIPIRKAVITVPAYFNEAQRRATREAGELAGLEVVRILHEPTAASLVYEADFCREAPAGAEPRRVLVYDMGGGTFDVSVVEIHAGVVEVRASHGDTHLGGDDFDALLLDRVAERFLEKEGVDLRTVPRARARLLRSLERAKRVLSSEPFAVVEEEFVAERDGVPLHLSAEISRNEYEELIAPLVERSMGSVQEALHLAGLLARDIDEIILVGGATRTPLIQREIAERTGKDPKFQVDPDLCVALGASIEAALIAGEDVHSVLVDITPHSLGVSCVGERDGILTPYYYSVIIPRGTALPTSRSEVYGTLVDNQESVEVEIYQGEDSDVRGNAKLGNYQIQGLSARPAGNEIVCHFNLDLDGTLTVTTTEKATGLAKRIVISDALHSFSDDDRRAAEERLRALFGDDLDELEEEEEEEEEGEEFTDEVEKEIQERIEEEIEEEAADEEAVEEELEGEGLGEDDAIGGDRGADAARIQETVERVRALLDRMAPSDREEAIELIERASAELRAGRIERAREAHRELQDILFYIEEA